MGPMSQGLLAIYNSVSGQRASAGATYEWPECRLLCEYYMLTVCFTYVLRMDGLWKAPGVGCAVPFQSELLALRSAGTACGKHGRYGSAPLAGGWRGCSAVRAVEKTVCHLLASPNTIKITQHNIGWVNLAVARALSRSPQVVRCCTTANCAGQVQPCTQLWWCP